MMIQKPQVSVIVPNYNHAPYLKERIDSILNQTFQDFEVILMDDCSTDNTRVILLEYKEKYPDLIKLILQEKNVGPAQNFIDLITFPKSKYIAIFEGDDYRTDPYKLQKQFDYLKRKLKSPLFMLKKLVKALLGKI